MIGVTGESVVLIFHLVRGLPIYVGDILRMNMLKFRNNKQW